MDSIFGLKVETTDQQTYLKVVALGVISGYLGVSLLDTISLFISKRLVKQQQDVEREQSDLEELKQRAKAASKAADLRSLADAYWRWGMARNDTGMLDQALVLFDAAISADPKNPENYIKKSFVYAEKAKREKDKKPSYDMAIALTNAAIKVDESSARAYYDQACYKHLNGVGKLEVLHDLELGIQRNDMVRKLAKLDPDLEDLLEDADFKKLVATETAAIVLEKAAANA